MNNIFFFLFFFFFCFVLFFFSAIGTISQRINDDIKREKDESKKPKNSNKDVLVVGDFCGLHEIIFQEVVLKGLTPEQTRDYSKKVHKFALISMLHVIEVALERDIEIKDIVAADQITSIGNCGILDSQLASYIKRLWKEPRLRFLFKNAFLKNL
eukprot:Phypoly_transcript_17579.p1 GENE.Phypoly_transcript_17579~~Phypoly_transcript_17579.p1  ORF type:complete len:155 (+),score=20.65 Phypoly_transcript_17579:311-775(+)